MLALTLTAALAACGGGGGSNDSGNTASAVDANAVDANCNGADFKTELLCRVNKVRSAGATCPAYTDASNVVHPAQTFAANANIALRWNALLEQAALGHSTDMAQQDYFSHTSKDGRTLSQRVDATGYLWTSLGENIAAGYPSIEAVVTGWMNSGGHCQNIMKASFTEMGVAKVNSSTATYSNYWTMDLGTPRP